MLIIVYLNTLRQGPWSRLFLIWRCEFPTLTETSYVKASLVILNSQLLIKRLIFRIADTYSDN